MTVLPIKSVYVVPLASTDDAGIETGVEAVEAGEVDSDVDLPEGFNSLVVSIEVGLGVKAGSDISSLLIGATGLAGVWPVKTLKGAVIKLKSCWKKPGLFCLGAVAFWLDWAKASPVKGAVINEVSLLKKLTCFLTWLVCAFTGAEVFSAAKAGVTNIYRRTNTMAVIRGAKKLIFDRSITACLFIFDLSWDRGIFLL